MKPLFLLSFLTIVSVAHAQGTTATPPAAPKPLTRLLVDRDELRSIEVVTDRHESIAQLFARQRIALSGSLMISNKWGNFWEQMPISKSVSVFASYPLFNDAGLQMNYFGVELELEPPSPEVLKLFGKIPSESRDTVILAFDDSLSSSSVGLKRNRRARLIGRIHVSGSWRPESEKALFAFSPPTTK